MTSRWRFTFHPEWDPAKDAANLRKHGVRSKDATTVLYDALAISRPDYEHDGAEERWPTLGAAADGALLMLVHTYRELADGEVSVRIISARRPTKDELFQYQSGNYRIQDTHMRDEYDFSGAVRGKFYRKDAVIMAPFRLEVRVLIRLTALAEKRGTSPSELVSEMLDREAAAATRAAEGK
jgi:uncharacterized DUF497 family protein